MRANGSLALTVALQQAVSSSRGGSAAAAATDMNSGVRVALLAKAHHFGGVRRWFADRGVDAQLAQRLHALLEAGALPEPEVLAAELTAPRPQAVPAVLLQLPTLAQYDTMITGVL